MPGYDDKQQLYDGLNAGVGAILQSGRTENMYIYIYGIFISRGGKGVKRFGLAKLIGTRAARNTLMRVVASWSLEQRCTSAIFDPDGSFVLCAHGSTVSLWNALTEVGSHVQDYKGHARSIYTLALAENRRNLATGGEDRSVCLWDAVNPRVIRRFHGHLQQVNCVAFSSVDGGNFMASASRDCTVRLWDSRAPSVRFPIEIIEGAKDSVEWVDLYKHVIVTASLDGHLRVYDARKTSQTVDKIGGIQGAPSLTCSRISKDLAMTLITSLPSAGSAKVGTKNESLILFDNELGQRLCTFSGPKMVSLKAKCSWSAGESKVACTSEDGTLWTWDVLTEECERLHLSDSPIVDVAFHPVNDNLILVAQSDGLVCLVDARRDGGT